MSGGCLEGDWKVSGRHHCWKPCVPSNAGAKNEAKAGESVHGSSLCMLYVVAKDFTFLFVGGWGEGGRGA